MAELAVAIANSQYSDVIAATLPLCDWGSDLAYLIFELYPLYSGHCGLEVECPLPAYKSECESMPEGLHVYSNARFRASADICDTCVRACNMSRDCVSFRDTLASHFIMGEQCEEYMLQSRFSVYYNSRPERAARGTVKRETCDERMETFAAQAA